MEPSKEHAMDHVVLVLFENRSFDNLLGHLYTRDEKPDFEGVDGRELTNPVPDWARPVDLDEPGARPGVVRYRPAPECQHPRPGPGGGVLAHQHPALQHRRPGQPRGVGPRHGDPQRPAGRCRAPDDGRVRHRLHQHLPGAAGRGPRYAQYRQIMEGHTPDQVPVLSGIARGFAVFDHWFSEVPSQTFPNRSFWTAATSSGLVVNSPATTWYRHNDAETIFDRLEAHGRTWKVYVLEPCPLSITGAIHTPRLKEWFAERFVPFAEFERDVAAGTLPDFCLVEPNLLSGHADYHPPSATPSSGTWTSTSTAARSSAPASSSWPGCTRRCARRRSTVRRTCTTPRCSSAGTSRAAPSTTCRHRPRCRPTPATVSSGSPSTARATGSRRCWCRRGCRSDRWCPGSSATPR